MSRIITTQNTFLQFNGCEYRLVKKQLKTGVTKYKEEEFKTPCALPVPIPIGCS